MPILPTLHPLFQHSLLRIIHLRWPIETKRLPEQNNWAVSTLWWSINLALFLHPRKDKSWWPGATSENELQAESVCARICEQEEHPGQTSIFHELFFLKKIIVIQFMSYSFHVLPYICHSSHCVFKVTTMYFINSLFFLRVSHPVKCLMSDLALTVQLPIRGRDVFSPCILAKLLSFSNRCSILPTPSPLPMFILIELVLCIFT